MKTKLHILPFPSNKVSRTFFHSALMAAVVLLLALGGAKFLTPSSSSARQNSQNSGGQQSNRISDRKSCPSCSQRADQFIYAPLIDLPKAQGSELVFNSRSPQEMDVTPTFYKLDGTAIMGRTVRVKSLEIRYVDLKKLIPGRYRNDRDWGGMTLAYTGGTREMWAQLRLLSVNGGGSVDVFFTVPQESRSDLQEAVWWAPPQSLAIIALGNITDTATSATVRFGDGQTQSVNLAPHATEIIRHAPNSWEGGQSVVINITGAAGSVIPTGLITSGDGSFNSVIRFYGTKAARQPHLFANGLRLAGVTPHMILKNTSSAPITATPEFIPSGDGSAGNPVTLPAIALSPKQTVEVDLGPLMNAFQSRNDLNTVSAKVSNNGAPGSLIGAIYCSDYSTGINYDVPLRDSGPLRNATGSYPWRMDDDYSTVVSITNIGSQPADFIATIRYEGGEYLPQLRNLAVGETAVFDLNKIRDEQLPSKDGKILPRKAKVGQFHWSVLRGGDNVRLIGRAEMVSTSKKVSSSYSCPVCCPDVLTDLVSNPGSPLIPSGGSVAVFVDGIWLDCYFNTVGPFGYSNLFNWWCEDPSVVYFTSVPTPFGYQNTAFGLAPGFSLTEARIQEVWYQNDGMDCYPFMVDIADPGDATVRPLISVSPTAFDPTQLSLGPAGVKTTTASVSISASPASQGGLQPGDFVEVELIKNTPGGVWTFDPPTQKKNVPLDLGNAVTAGFTITVASGTTAGSYSFTIRVNEVKRGETIIPPANYMLQPSQGGTAANLAVIP